MAPARPVLLITGAQAAGKSTVARAVAARAVRGVFLDGDVYWQAVVAGRHDMDERHSPEAVEQLHLRYRALAAAARVYAGAGFCTVVAENVYGDDVEVLRDGVAPLRLLTVALVPAPEVVAERERGRGSPAYAGWTSGRALEDAVREFCAWAGATPADLRHDSSHETPQETAQAVHSWVAGRW